MESSPLVSCIMPTYNRRHFVPRAIEYFLRQDYQNKELIIVDDGSDAIEDILPKEEQIHYVRLHQKLTIGAKRNLACEQSRGELIVHWDDDDWHASHRLSYQVDHLLRAKAEVCGLRQMLFLDIAASQPWLYEYPANQRFWLAGGSLMYTRLYWQRAAFPNISIGEDARFLWSHKPRGVVPLPDYTFYVAFIHPGNTSPKVRRGSYWSPWRGELGKVMGGDLQRYQADTQGALYQSSSLVKKDRAARQDRQTNLVSEARMSAPPTYSVIMVTHNTLKVTQMAVLRTLQHSTSHDMQLIVVDNASTDGTQEWLDLLAQRGDIKLLKNKTNVGHGPALEMARRETQSPYLVTLDSDAFPISDDWLAHLRLRLRDKVKVVGIRHHRDYVHPSCLMIARETLETFQLSFLNEKDQPSQFDVAERISHEIKRRGYEIAGLKQTDAQRRGSVSEPIYLGSQYEGLVYHQWYTTRAAISGNRPVDDVSRQVIEDSLQEVLQRYQAEPKDLRVVVGIRLEPNRPERQRNVLACLHALNMQDIPRWKYQIILVEQDIMPRLERELAPLADRYVFAQNPGPYNRGWGFNIGACLTQDEEGILCLMDADLLVGPDFLRNGLSGVKAGKRAVLPYHDVVYLDESSTLRVIKDRHNAPLGKLRTQGLTGRSFTTAQGGCIFIEDKLYHTVGGHDENFRGWGSEDREFWDRINRTTPIERLEGHLLHLNHPRPDMDDRWAKANAKLYQQLSLAPQTNRPRKIGALDRYSGLTENTIPSSTTAREGRRDWENWHRWQHRRIEGIVRQEQEQSSQRQSLAKVLTQLGSSLLDVGCGPGAMWLHFPKSSSDFSWAGVDVTSQMVTIAHQLFPQAPVAQGDVGGLPFRNGSFDVVLLRHVLEHVPDWLMERALAEATRVARKVVALAFYVPPITHGPRSTRRVGENFLETRWTVEDLETRILKTSWQVCRRFSLKGQATEADIIWLLKPPTVDLSDLPLQAMGPSEQAKISIIMPTYRRAHTLLHTVETIQMQTYQNWELIIVDNAGDCTFQSEDPRIHLYRHTLHASSSYARNQGLQHVTGDLVCFFDDDDDMFPYYLERLALAFEENPHAKLVRSGMLVTGGKTNFSFATPECCLRREFAVPIWSNNGPGQDQRYFKSIIAANNWSEQNGDIIMIREALCWARANPRGGLRSGHY